MAMDDEINNGFLEINHTLRIVRFPLFKIVQSFIVSCFHVSRLIFEPVCQGYWGAWGVDHDTQSKQKNLLQKKTSRDSLFVARGLITNPISTHASVIIGRKPSSRMYYMDVDGKII